MRLVLDASVVLPFVSLSTSQGDSLRLWLLDELAGSAAHIVHTHTRVEVLAGLRELELTGRIAPDWAEHVQRQSAGWPFVRELLTPQRTERMWELRTRFNIHDAAYVATTESLQAEMLEDVALCTADPLLRRAELPCAVVVAPTFD